ncbi:MAG: hypothetical protein CBB68_07480 [Rhodospirillaceae bacterium TMED8]|nr:colicin V synthesis protein [Magnetovibrio sp.]OUT50826.1 MAG: hypothetical protein CBB68_07480 [Rhodospirillaceae bacterium TMED8]|tara:strand:+ start:288 stop:968 length:681 start_codon:yes stop_codon:yes gene_type:complete
MEGLSEFPINIFDIGVIAALVISALLARARGFVHEVLAIAGWIGAIFVTFYSFPHLQAFTRQLISMELVADLTTGVGTFLVTLVFLSIVTRSISKRVQASALNALDRALGFLFGLIRGALIVIIAYIGLDLVIPQDNRPDFVKNARTMKLIELSARELIILLPDNLNESTRMLGTKPISNGANSTPGKVVLDIITPKSKTVAPGSPEGYRQRQRQEMDRLIGNTLQ